MSDLLIARLDLLAEGTPIDSMAFVYLFRLGSEVRWSQYVLGGHPNGNTVYGTMAFTVPDLLPEMGALLKRLYPSVTIEDSPTYSYDRANRALSIGADTSKTVVTFHDIAEYRRFREEAAIVPRTGVKTLDWIMAA